MVVLTEERNLKAKNSEMNDDIIMHLRKIVEEGSKQKASVEMKLDSLSRKLESEMKDCAGLIDCVTTVSSKTKDKNLIIQSIQKLRQETVVKLKGFFEANKIKI